jgi:hypothetical protein
MKVFPTVIVLLFSCAAIEAAWSRDLDMFIFYAASAAINVVVA